MMIKETSKIGNDPLCHYILKIAVISHMYKGRERPNERYNVNSPGITQPASARMKVSLVSFLAVARRTRGLFTFYLMTSSADINQSM